MKTPIFFIFPTYRGTGLSLASRPHFPKAGFCLSAESGQGTASRGDPQLEGPDLSSAAPKSHSPGASAASTGGRSEHDKRPGARPNTPRGLPAARAQPPNIRQQKKNPTILQSHQRAARKAGQPQSHLVDSVRSPNPSASRSESNRLIIHIKATFNNTLLTLTNFKGQVITWVSAGSCGFKGARKGTPFAAKKVVEIFIKKSNDYFFRCDQIKIYVCGVGPGRENAIRGLASIAKTIKPDKRTNKAISKLSNKIVLIREMTKIPHNGCRPTKKRRI